MLSQLSVNDFFFNEDPFFFFFVISNFSGKKFEKHCCGIFEYALIHLTRRLPNCGSRGTPVRAQSIFGGSRKVFFNYMDSERFMFFLRTFLSCKCKTVWMAIDFPTRIWVVVLKKIESQTDLTYYIFDNFKQTKQSRTKTLKFK